MASFPQSLVPTIRNGLEWMIESPEFIRDNLPPNASGGAKFLQETGRRICRVYARVRSATGGIAYAPVYSNLCTPYLDSINEGPTTDGSYGPPFTGGQCSKTYLVTMQGPNRCPSGTLTDAFAEGPISGLIVVPNSGYVGGCAGPPNTSVSLKIKGGVVPGNPTGLYNVGIAHLHADDAPNWRITSVSPVSGADNCGDLPPVYDPPTFPPNLPPLPPPVNPAPGDGINWEVNIDLNGEIYFCIAGECSTSFPPHGTCGPDSGGGPGDPDGSPQTTDPNDPNNPNEVDGSAKDGNYLTGLKIQIVQSPPNYQGLGNIYYKSCWVWMGPAPSLLDMVLDGKTIESGQFVIPDSRDCTSFKVRANPGFRVSVQAYSRPKLE